MTDWRDTLIEKHGHPRIIGIDVGDGWRPIVEAFYAYIGRHGCLRAAQIKEKFGAARLYYDHAYDCNECDHADIEYHHHAISGIESVSYYTCEVCSAYGTQSSGGGWIKTLCDEHHGERNR